jgi:hypothetical protein
MTERTGYLSGVALMAIGAFCFIVVHGAAPQPLAAYLIVQAVVLHWGMLVYGVSGALGALALSAFAPVLLASDAGLGGAAGWALTAFVLARCMLDPTVQWALAIAAAGLVALLLSGSATLAVPLIVYSALLALLRTATAERWERRWRVLQASLVAALIGWATLALLLGGVGHWSHLPEVDDISAAPAIQFAAADSRAAPRAAGGVAAVPLIPLLLAALRPWRAQRRFSDAAWMLAVLVLVVGPPPGGWAAAVTPFLALLAGASWDAVRPSWARRAATGLAAVQGAGAIVGLVASSTVPANHAAVRPA